jgi:hypothetical protein
MLRKRHLERRLEKLRVERQPIPRLFVLKAGDPDPVLENPDDPVLIIRLRDKVSDKKED